KETEKEVTPEMQKQFLSIADRNLKRLGVLIDDLLDLSKLEAGKMTLKREPAAIEEIVDESIGNLDAWARAKSIKIEKRAQQNIPKVKMDSNRIIQVLNNLIGNAIKFTPQNGTIIIETGLEKGGKEIRISVEDTGIGIEKENLPRVFDKFYHTTERISTDISGTGLGLSIAKEIVELHGGRIWVESEKDSGARFAFTLKPA
ncbi:MAG: cell wall metabolism sensor histidine kinase WalK, partial [Candidatus Omnitrophica bacterium]|nr:cell wall metabolism sensor histidine kinase WalK [Candidatus Omnitrophota bacterium]